ncbi:hypothetical protein, partial [Bacteroides ovatus]
MKMRLSITLKLSLVWFVLAGMVLGRYTEPAFLIIATLFIMLQLNKVYVSTSCLFVGTLFFFHSLSMVVYNGYDTGKLFQQIVLLFTCVFCYYQIFRYCQIPVSEWFRRYVSLVYILSIIGIVQFVIMSATQIDIFPYTLDGTMTQNTGRLHAMLMEPGSFTAFSIPAAAYVFLAPGFMKYNRMKSLVIGIALILTLTTSMIVAVVIILFLKFYYYFKYLRIGLVVCFIVGVCWCINNRDILSSSEYFVNPQLRAIQEKITQTLSMVEYAEPEDFEHLNTSSYVILTNYWIAFNAPCRILGTGLGTHAQNYERMYKSDFGGYGLNKDDAYSMFARLYSEFGVLGLCLYAFFLIRY